MLLISFWVKGILAQMAFEFVDRHMLTHMFFSTCVCYWFICYRIRFSVLACRLFKFFYLQKLLLQYLVGAWMFLKGLTGVSEVWVHFLFPEMIEYQNVLGTVDEKSHVLVGPISLFSKCGPNQGFWCGYCSWFPRIVTG